MSKGTKKVFEVIKDVAGKVWDEMEHPVSMGAQEAAVGLFTGAGFVMYPRAGKENAQGKSTEGPEPPAATPEQEQDRGR